MWLDNLIVGFKINFKVSNPIKFQRNVVIKEKTNYRDTSRYNSEIEENYNKTHCVYKY